MQRNIHQYGGDGANLFLCGHSAGAHLAMLAAAQPRSVVCMPVLVGAVQWVTGRSCVFMRQLVA